MSTLHWLPELPDSTEPRLPVIRARRARPGISQGFDDPAGQQAALDRREAELNAYRFRLRCWTVGLVVFLFLAVYGFILLTTPYWKGGH